MELLFLLVLIIFCVPGGFEGIAEGIKTILSVWSEHRFKMEAQKADIFSKQKDQELAHFLLKQEQAAILKNKYPTKGM